jgi:sulfatase-modifying factor enzyme 1
MPCAVIAAALLAFLLMSARGAEGASGAKPSPPLARHLAAIAGRAQAAPLVTVPAGDFTVGSKRIDDDPYGLWTQFDDTELPQQRVRLDEFAIDRDEVSLGEYLAYLARERRDPAEELQKLLWHVITVHSVSDQTLARWPALYVTWHDAVGFAPPRESAFRPKQNGKKPHGGLMASSFPGATPPRTQNGRCSASTTCMRFRFSPPSIHMPPDEAHMASTIWRATSPNGYMIGLDWTTTRTCPGQIRPDPQVAGIKACAADHGRVTSSCFARRREAASAPISGRRRSASAALNHRL